MEIDPKRVAVLFDFDGTIGDTETPAMKVAYWELAPYFPAAACERKQDENSSLLHNRERQMAAMLPANGSENVLVCCG